MRQAKPVVRWASPGTAAALLDGTIVEIEIAAMNAVTHATTLTVPDAGKERPARLLDLGPIHRPGARD